MRTSPIVSGAEDTRRSEIRAVFEGSFLDGSAQRSHRLSSLGISRIRPSQVNSAILQRSATRQTHWRAERRPSVAFVHLVSLAVLAHRQPIRRFDSAGALFARGTAMPIGTCCAEIR